MLKGNHIKLALHRAVLAFSLLSMAAVPTAMASEPAQPTSLKELKSYKFVVERDGNERTMRIEDKKFGVIGDAKSGYITYRVVKWKGKSIVRIDMIKGVKGLRGVGKLLKKEVLKRHSKRPIASDLVLVNREKLLKAWAKDFPHKKNETNGERFRKVVPAMKFEGFDYTITPKVPSSGVGGTIELEMKRSRGRSKGKIVIDDPIALDKILATTEPEMIRAKDRPKTQKDLDKEHKDNEDAAKDVRKLLKDHAEEVADDEDVDKKDLFEHLEEAMEDECGRGGSDGKGWAKDCLFTPKGRRFVIKIKKRASSSFYLDDLLEDEVKYFLK